MAIRRPTPIKLTANQSKSLQKQLSNQPTTRSAPKSSDPNFPVFEIPVNKRVLVYVPNHVVMDANGEPTLRMDEPLLHAVQDGKRFMYIRCTKDAFLKDEDGNDVLDANGKPLFDGTCPLCDGTDVPWDLANLTIKQKCSKMNLDPEDRNNNTVKGIRSAAFSGRVLKEANKYLTFPIVVIETENDEGRVPKMDENNNLIAHPMWYHISESQYNEKWLSTLEGLEDEPTHPGGHFFVLNYTYDTKGKDANKRDSAKNLKVIGKTIKKSEKLRQAFDKMTEDWTPEKAMEVVVSNQAYTVSDLTDIADKLLEQPRDMIALLQAAESTGKDVSTGDGFNLVPPEDSGRAALEDGMKKGSTAVAQMDETDEDDADGSADDDLDLSL